VCAYNNSQTPKTNYMKKVYLALISLAIGGAAIAQDSPVVNQTTGIGYENLEAAWDAAKSDEVILVNADQEIAKRLGGSERNLTLKGASKDIVVKRAESYKDGLMFLSSTGSTVTIEDLTIDGNNIEMGSLWLEAGKMTGASAAGTLVLNNLILKNMNSTNGQGLIAQKSGGILKMTSVVVENCVVPEGRGHVFSGNNQSVTFGGLSKFSIYLEKDLKVNVDGLLDGSEVTLYWDITNAKRINGGNKAIVRGVVNPELVKSGVPGFFLESEKSGNNNLKISLSEPTVTVDGEPAGETTLVNGEAAIVEANGIKYFYTYGEEPAAAPIEGAVEYASPVVLDKTGKFNVYAEYTSGTDVMYSAVKTIEVESGSTTGIEGVEADENAPAEYYNLQGVRVANPENGIFIRRQGAKVEKVYVK